MSGGKILYFKNSLRQFFKCKENPDSTTNQTFPGHFVNK